MTYRVLSLVLGLSLALCSTGAVAQDVSLEALYAPDSGNITMRAVNADGTPGVLQIATFQFLSPLQYLSGVAASIPSSAVSFATVSNTDASTFFTPARTGAEIYATNFSGATPLFFSTWDLGNVANTGLTQSQLNAGFTTDGDVTPGGLPLSGKFLFQKQGDATFYPGNLTAVPEPSTLGLFAAACAAVSLEAVRRRRGRTSTESGRLNTQMGRKERDPHA